jgi:hypothetical protein
MTQTKCLFVILIVATGIVACKSSATVIGTWINKEKVQGHPKVKSVFINVMTQNQVVKSALENDLADAAAAKGIKSEKSYYIFGPVRSRESLPPKELILNNIKKLGCDAIFIVAVIDQKSETRYTPSSTMYNPMPGYYGYYGTFGSYYNYSSLVYTPGYYTTDNTYYLESNLYDATTEDLLVSMQSKVVNPKSIEKSSKEYTKALIEELEKQGFLKK